MSQVIVGPTSIAQWHQLISDAEARLQIILGEEAESYLVFMLMRFLEKPEIAKSALAIEFLENIQHGIKRLEDLRDLGDKCLLYSGLFPQCARRKQVTVSYFVRLGQNAYHLLAKNTQRNWAELYSALTQKFIPMMDILQTIREQSSSSLSLSAIEALDLWEETASAHAYQTLKKYTHNMDILRLRANTRH